MRAVKIFLKKIVPGFVFGWYHYLWALAGAFYYRFPSKKLNVIGITGTNGKSTVAHFINRILEEAGHKTAVLSSIDIKIGDSVVKNKYKMTMPGRAAMQRFLHQAVKAKCRYAVLEVTSEGIKQHRHRFIDFNTAVFTNLAPEHLESHGGLEGYKRTKGRFFRAVGPKGRLVVNLDDKEAEYFLSFPAMDKIGYGMENSSSKADIAIIKGSNVQADRRGVEFKVKDEQIHLNLLGRFNAYNALAATAVCLAEGISLANIKSALNKIHVVPGRLEIVQRDPFLVVVDYAHTPDALEEVYRTLKDFVRGKMIGVVGAAGGGRDKWKRPVIGRIAEKYLDEIVITNEDPYDEDPKEIIEQIIGGMVGKRASKVLDRKEAIKQALAKASEGDAVIITGKGCEPWMCVKNGEKIPWDDRGIVREAL